MVGFCVCGVVLALILQLQSRPTVETPLGKLEQQPSPLAQRTGHTQVLSSPLTPECRQIKPLHDPGRLYVGPDEGYRERLLEQAFLDPISLAGQAPTNPEAYIALFSLAAACFPELMHPGKSKRRIIEGCPNVQMAFDGHPLELLQLAADAGSVEGKLRYALNARLYASYYRSGNTLGNGQSVNDILQRAERFGDESARAGYPDAYRYMSDAYQNGLFGRPNITQALAFAFPLSMVGDESDKQRIENLLRKVTKAEMESARQNAFGCEKIPYPSSVISPF